MSAHHGEARPGLLFGARSCGQFSIIDDRMWSLWMTGLFVRDKNAK
jgi:hypothetical protein